MPSKPVITKPYQCPNCGAWECYWVECDSCEVDKNPDGTRACNKIMTDTRCNCEEIDVVRAAVLKCIKMSEELEELRVYKEGMDTWLDDLGLKPRAPIFFIQGEPTDEE